MIVLTPCGAGIALRAHDVVAQPCNRLATDIVRGLAADDFPSMVGRITDCDDFQGQGISPVCSRLSQ
jgi:hypothetical protein